MWMASLKRAGCSQKRSPSGWSKKLKPPSNSACSKRPGYSKGKLANLLDDAELGTGCGNSTDMNGLKPGEVVVDLSAGGGADCLLAGNR